MLPPKTSRLTVVATAVVVGLAFAALYTLWSSPEPQRHSIGSSRAELPPTVQPYENFATEQKRQIQQVQEMLDKLEKAEQNQKTIARNMKAANKDLRRQLTAEQAARKTERRELERERDDALKVQQTKTKKAIDDALRQLVTQQQELRQTMQDNEASFEAQRTALVEELNALKAKTEELPKLVKKQVEVVKEQVVIPGAETVTQGDTSSVPADVAQTIATSLQNQAVAIQQGQTTASAAPVRISIEPTGIKRTDTSKSWSPSMTRGLATSRYSDRRRESRPSNQQGKKPATAKVLKRFTLNTGAMVKLTLATDLAGMIPINGSTTSYTALAIVNNRDKNPATTGFYLPPDINKMTVLGRVIGDPIFQCARVMVTKVSFAFNDGTLREQEASVSDPFGFFASPQGLPCLVGEMRENVDGYASKHAAYTVISEATRQASRSMTSDQISQALGGGFADGITDWSRLMQDMNQDTLYAAVYVPSSVRIEGRINPNSGTEYWPVHVQWVVTKQIELDYEPTGRKLIHENYDRLTRSYRLD